MLSSNLKRLEDFEILERTAYAEVPSRAECSLTPLGRSAALPRVALRDWAEDHGRR